jgi:hypothetical protein
LPPKPSTGRPGVPVHLFEPYRKVGSHIFVIR